MSIDLKQWADERGYKVAWGEIGLLAQVRADVLRRREIGQIDSEFFDERLRWVGAPEPDRSAFQSVILIAIRRPAHAIEFQFDSGVMQAIAPPTYVDYDRTLERVRQDLAQSALWGLRVEPARTSFKTLASLLGLARFGRNNLAYVDGFGSYCELVAVITDAVLPAAGAQPRDMLETILPACRKCRLCLDACPTSAIGAERVLLKAERCVTRFNEVPGAVPDGIPVTQSDCLLGCMECQTVCPYNRGKLETVVSGVSFTKEETSALLAGSDAAGDAAWRSADEKLESLELATCAEFFGRNLASLSRTIEKIGMS